MDEFPESTVDALLGPDPAAPGEDKTIVLVPKKAEKPPLVKGRMVALIDKAGRRYYVFRTDEEQP